MQRSLAQGHLDVDARRQIIRNLEFMRMSPENAERILNAVESMPGKDHIKGALKFLTQITNEKSKREEYYVHSNYLAEYFCTLSNLGMFAVGFYYNDFATLIAATFSALSHAIPAQRLHDLDILGVMIVFGKVITNYKTFMERPELLAWGAGALMVNALDTVITRKYLDKIGPSIHVVWHLAAALALYKLDQGTLEVTAQELQSIALATQSGSVPAYLTSAYNTIAELMSNVTRLKNCTIV